MKYDKKVFAWVIMVFVFSTLVVGYFSGYFWQCGFCKREITGNEAAVRFLNQIADVTLALRMTWSGITNFTEVATKNGFPMKDIKTVVTSKNCVVYQIRMGDFIAHEDYLSSGLLRGYGKTNCLKESDIRCEDWNACHICIMVMNDKLGRGRELRRNEHVDCN